MKTSRGISWYIFAIYATSVIVNYTTHRQHLSLSSWNWFSSNGDAKLVSNSKVNPSHPRQQPQHPQSNLVRCVLYEDAGSKSWTRDCRPLMRQMRKELITVVESVAQSPAMIAILTSIPMPESIQQKHSQHKSSKSSKGKSNRTISHAAMVASAVEQTLKKMIQKENDQMIRWFAFIILGWAVISAFLLAPIWPCSSYVYQITVIAVALLASLSLLRIIKSTLHIGIRLITCNRYHFWLLPNLSEDVGLLESFWPLCILMHRDQLNRPALTDEMIQTEELSEKESKISQIHTGLNAMSVNLPTTVDDNRKDDVQEGMETSTIDLTKNIIEEDDDDDNVMMKSIQCASKDEMDVCLDSLKKSTTGTKIFDLKFDHFDEIELKQEVMPSYDSVDHDDHHATAQVACSEHIQSLMKKSSSEFHSKGEEMNLKSTDPILTTTTTTAKPMTLTASSLSLSSLLLQPVKELKDIVMKEMSRSSAKMSAKEEEFEILDSDFDTNSSNQHDDRHDDQGRLGQNLNV